MPFDYQLIYLSNYLFIFQKCIVWYLHKSTNILCTCWFLFLSFNFINDLILLWSAPLCPALPCTLVLLYSHYGVITIIIIIIDPYLRSDISLSILYWKNSLSLPDCCGVLSYSVERCDTRGCGEVYHAKVWYGVACCCSVWCVMVCVAVQHGVVRVTVRCGEVWLVICLAAWWGVLWFGVICRRVCCSTVWYNVFNSVACCNSVWYGMMWYGVLCCVLFSYSWIWCINVAANSYIKHGINGIRC